jgi:hypothetical protein
MRHGTKLPSGFVVGQRVKVTSKKLHIDGMPGLVTGDSPSHVRVRIYLPETNGRTWVVWVLPRQLS